MTVRQIKFSVIIPTYNRCDALKFTIQSVMNQTMGDFEIIVVGDHCTDNSEYVVKAFEDDRIQWHNLEKNSGNQSTPNNFGLSQASGRMIAYLGHDDLWHPSHLELMEKVMLKELGGDLGYSITIHYAADGKIGVTGVTPNRKYVPGMALPSSCLVHRRFFAERLGGWRTREEQIKIDKRAYPPDQDLVQRFYHAKHTIVNIPHITVFKAESNKESYEKGLYLEQKKLLERMQKEEDFLYNETLRALIETTIKGEVTRIAPVRG